MDIEEPAQMTKARQTAEKIWNDILDRSKINDVFEDIEPQIKHSIIYDWGKIIANNHPLSIEFGPGSGGDTAPDVGVVEGPVPDPTKGAYDYNRLG